MRIDKPDDMALLVQRGRERTAAPACLSMLCAMELRPGQPATLLPEEQLWSRATAALGPDGALAAGLPPHGAQVLLLGRAWPAPGQATASHVQVELRVFTADPSTQAPQVRAAIDKRLDVHGDRDLESPDGARRPAEFSAMPLDLSRAFGGPGHPTNPQGRGSAAIQLDGRRCWPMPNLQDPADPLRRAGQQVAVATLGPLSPLQRALPAEQADAAAHTWLSGWPHADMPTAQQAHAPRDQWLPRDLRGDERVELLHLHPQHSPLRASLHGLRPRCLWGTPVEGDPGTLQWSELSLRAHTLWLFPETLLAVMMYHAQAPAGMLPTARDQWLVAAWEPLGEAPRQASEYVQRWRQRQDAAEPETAPQPAPVPAPPPPAPSAAAAEASPQASAAQDTEDVIGRLRRRGWSSAQIDDLLRRDWLPSQAAATPPLQDVLRQLQEQTQALRTQHGLDDATIQRFVDIAERDPAAQSPDSAATPQAAIAQALAQLEQHTRQALERAGLNEAQAEQVLREHDPKLAQTLQRMREPPAPAAPAASAQARGPAPGPREPALAEATRAQVEQWLRDGVSLRARVLDGLDLRGLDFSGADMRAVVARAARFDACRMPGADLTGAILHDAGFENTDLQRATLRDSSCARANLARARLSEADCGGADFTEAALQGAALDGANLRRAVFERSDLREVRAPGCDARDAQFAGCVADASDWQGAQLDDSGWLECSLRQARFPAAKARNINLQGSDASDCDFSGADLRGSRATAQSRLPRANLRHSDLRDACWEGAQLQGAALAQCQLDGADLSSVHAQQVDLRAVHGSTLRLDDADLRGADLRQAKLVQASLSGADLRQARLEGAMCFGADLADVRRDPDTLSGADVRRTVAAALPDMAPGAPASDSPSGAHRR